jgi:hypothetical protein
MSMTFTKLFSSITASTIWAAPDQTRIVWITMLAMADQHGRVWASIPGLANIARVNLDACEAALAELQSPDKYSRTTDHEGRRIEPIDGGWRLLNYAKYRAIRDAESAKEAKRKYINGRRASERESLSKSASTVDRGRSEVDRCRVNTEAEAEAEADALNTNTQPRKRGAAARLVSVESLITDGVEAQHAADWLACRKAKSLPLTVTAWERTKAEAAKAGITPAQAIKEAAGHGWAGFKASWLANAQAGNAVSSGSKPIVNKQIEIENENLRVASLWSASRGSQNAA